MAPVSGVVYAVQSMKRGIRVAPSILAADFLRLGQEIETVEAGGADAIHVDVMDGRFVPNLVGGPAWVSAARRATRLPLDVHLMIAEPDRYIEAYAEAGADIIGIHVEVSDALQRSLVEIRRLGKKSCAVLNPHTSEEVLRYVLGDLDQILLMTVNPGFSGQEFLRSVVPKIRRVRQMVEASGLTIDIEVDGGISVENAKIVASEGANLLVAGVSVFGESDRAEAIQRIREAARS